MCDLIDLNSPKVGLCPKRLLDPRKLASPLIPAPKNVASNGETNSSVTTENEDNNPFDRVLREIADYVSKYKGDPFEVMNDTLLEAVNTANENDSLRTDSESSIDDDLIAHITLWMSELSAFEHELVVDDLIELSILPEENIKDKNNDKKQSATSIDNASENSLKEMEPQFTDSVKQTVVTSLVADLRKLIKENNSKSNKLLDNLEKILDSNCKNNTELLVACLNTSNEWQSPRKISSDIENLKK